MTFNTETNYDNFVRDYPTISDDIAAMSSEYVDRINTLEEQLCTADVRLRKKGEQIAALQNRLQKIETKLPKGLQT